MQPWLGGSSPAEVFLPGAAPARGRKNLCFLFDKEWAGVHSPLHWNHSQGITAVRSPGGAKGAFAGKLNQAASIFIWQPGQRVLRGQAGGFVTQWQAAPGELRQGRALPPPLDLPWGWRPVGKRALRGASGGQNF